MHINLPANLKFDCDLLLKIAGIIGSFVRLDDTLHPQSWKSFTCHIWPRIARPASTEDCLPGGGAAGSDLFHPPSFILLTGQWITHTPPRLKFKALHLPLQWGGCSGELGAQFPQDVFSWMSLKWEDFFCFCSVQELWIFYLLRSHQRCFYLGIFRVLEEAWETHIVTKQPFVAACIKDPSNVELLNLPQELWCLCCCCSVKKTLFVRFVLLLGWIYNRTKLRSLTA